MKNSLLFFLIISNISFSQNFATPEQYHYGTSGWDNPDQTIKCQDNGFLLISSSAGNDHDKSQASFGGDDIWVVRLNADKTIRWEKTFGGDQDDKPKYIVELASGNILILADSYSGVSGNKTSVNYGDKDYWVLKLSSAGNKIWEKSFGTSMAEVPSTILEISDTNYVIIGGSQGGVSGSKTEASFGGTDIWAIGIDSTGTELWQKTYGGNSVDSPMDRLSIKLQNSNVLILSNSLSGVSGNKNTPNYGSNDGWVLEISSMNGQIIEENNFGGADIDYLFQGLQLDGDIYLVGSSRSEVSGNKQSALHGTTDAWLLKLDQNLNIVSDQSFGGTNASSFKGISKTDFGMVVYGVARNDGNPWVAGTVKGAYDAWFVGFDSLGDYQWDFIFGTNTSIDIVNGFFENSHNNYTFSYSTTSPGNDGDLTISSYGSYDLYLIDLTTDLAVLGNSKEEFVVYPNPVVNSLSISGAKELSFYEITDLNGKIVSRGNYSGVIDCSPFNQGFYTLRITSSDQVFVKKFVKQ